MNSYHLELIYCFQFCKKKNCGCSYIAALAVHDVFPTVVRNEKIRLFNKVNIYIDRSLWAECILFIHKEVCSKRRWILTMFMICQSFLEYIPCSWFSQSWREDLFVKTCSHRTSEWRAFLHTIELLNMFCFIVIQIAKSASYKIRLWFSRIL